MKRQIKGGICLMLCSSLFLGGCAVTQREQEMNTNRMNSFRQVNTTITYQPIIITGIKKMEGENMTITTNAELKQLDVPNLQYDTSRNEIIGKAVGVAGNVLMGGVAAVAAIGVTKAVGDATKVQVVKSEPVIVKPTVIGTDGKPTADAGLPSTGTTSDPTVELAPADPSRPFTPPAQ